MQRIGILNRQEGIRRDIQRSVCKLARKWYSMSYAGNLHILRACVR